MQIESVVYFVKHEGLVKIGYTADLAVRLRSLPGELIAFLPGGRADEASFHRRFHPLRMHGEWFRNEPPLSTLLGFLPRCAAPPHGRPIGTCAVPHLRPRPMKGSVTALRPGKWRLRVFVGARPNGTPVHRSATVYGDRVEADRVLAEMVASRAVAS